MFVVAVVGVIVFLLGHPQMEIGRHVHDDAESTGAERRGEV
jgi:hypothetical protein